MAGGGRSKILRAGEREIDIISGCQGGEGETSKSVVKGPEKVGGGGGGFSGKKE